LPEVRIVRQGSEREGEACPSCGRWTTKRHDVRERVKLDEPLGERRVILVLRRRRFRCLPCRRAFSEPEPLCGHRRRLTHRLQERLGRACRHQAVERIAAVYGVSPTTVRRSLTELVTAQRAEEAEPPEVLGIDEFSARKGQRYATALHDIPGKRVLEVVTGRTKEEVQKALERLPRPEMIRVVSMDMAGSFRAAVADGARRRAVRRFGLVLTN